ncbi:metal-sensitive transcriptional regulator [Halobacillus halophilus]|uniref:metal-sensitive transcriptional regulator n=1 Tax=Halobacillus TaxID=45667 RepID=UPI0002F6D25A|nr:metal-sensitive transcriptional regulator [Halobacillus halophilus]ASF38690.1 cytoplasmic protein [Halobacillus halophilus]MCA1012115.1 metal-sensitive transcriptional regulator [Halobacillus halophilus]
MEQVKDSNLYGQETKNRLKRIEGQVRGVLKMMDEDKDCKDVITQLSAARSAMDRAIGYIVAKNLEGCIREAHEEGESAEDLINEAVQMIVKSR